MRVHVSRKPLACEAARRICFRIQSQERRARPRPRPLLRASQGYLTPPSPHPPPAARGAARAASRTPSRQTRRTPAPRAAPRGAPARRGRVRAPPRTRALRPGQGMGRAGAGAPAARSRSARRPAAPRAARPSTPRGAAPPRGAPRRAATRPLPRWLPRAARARLRQQYGVRDAACPISTGRGTRCVHLVRGGGGGGGGGACGSEQPRVLRAGRGLRRGGM